MTETKPLLAMRGICKSFGANKANDGVDLTLHRGDILGLLGENGAGKTTLMNVLFGTYAADEGTIEIEGEPAAIHTRPTPSPAVSAWSTSISTWSSATP
jgi:simple sugar transport system ATP-binding protein